MPMLCCAFIYCKATQCDEAISCCAHVVVTMFMLCCALTYCNWNNRMWTMQRNATRPFRVAPEREHISYCTFIGTMKKQ
jgi:hypothetical protein